MGNTNSQPKRGRRPGKKYVRWWIFLRPEQLAGIEAFALERGEYMQEAARQLMDLGLAVDGQRLPSWRAPSE